MLHVSDTIAARKLDLIRTGMELSRAIEKISQPEVFCKIVVLKNFAKFIGKHLYQSCEFIIKTLENFTQ